jgi:hypothetical protein
LLNCGRIYLISVLLYSRNDVYKVLFLLCVHKHESHVEA